MVKLSLLKWGVLGVEVGKRWGHFVLKCKVWFSQWREDESVTGEVSRYLKQPLLLYKVTRLVFSKC